ncbi:MAG: cob(I)yrinic acid a,c-diamide adenosyltransferase [Deltaproteobacteria bacterium]|jgi:cob(I)alamin adenosyltransferase|nr:cob(I)yrinic acid a,c-diamide adenosyltransferase [Deltaproteobacteria bacterium]
MAWERGYIHIYMGKGKGKTTAALGLALRAAGHGLKVYMAQFLKSALTGEMLAAEKLAPYFTIFRFSGEHDFFTRLSAPERQEVRAEARSAFDFARRAMSEGACDILILDEILVALQHQLLDLSELTALLDQKPLPLELILTGRHAPAELVARADLVTRMEEVKHYYRAGVMSRAGIEK